jgi:transposase
VRLDAAARQRPAVPPQRHNPGARHRTAAAGHGGDAPGSANTCSPSSIPPEIAADNNSRERELRPTATERKVTGGFRSLWGAAVFAAVRSVIGTAARRGSDACQAIRMILQGQSIIATA